MKRSLSTLTTATILGLTLTACGESEPVVGVVVEKEYESAVWDVQQQGVYTDICSGVGTKRTCTKVRTGTRTVTVLKKAECYELELDTGWEGCVTRAAWKALNVEDTYDSSKRY